MPLEIDAEYTRSASQNDQSCKALWHAWMDVLYSPRCIGCDRLVEGGGGLLMWGCWEAIDRQPRTSSSQVRG